MKNKDTDKYNQNSNKNRNTASPSNKKLSSNALVTAYIKSLLISMVETNRHMKYHENS